MGLMNFEGSAKVEWAQLVRPLTMLADLLYPPGCASCGTATGGHRGLCPKCWSGVRFIERPYCEVLGSPFSHDLGTGILGTEAIANTPPFDRLRSAAFHDNAARNLVHGLKYRDRTGLAAMMAKWMLRAGDGIIERCDAILPVPLHRARMLSRKFNQVAELARHLAHLSGKPLLPATFLRTKRTALQVGLSAKARKDNVFGWRIILVDDVYATGATGGQRRPRFCARQEPPTSRFWPLQGLLQNLYDRKTTGFRLEIA
jgi:predicted amidophosphoribosyltransferase